MLKVVASENCYGGVRKLSGGGAATKYVQITMNTPNGIYSFSRSVIRGGGSDYYCTGCKKVNHCNTNLDPPEGACWFKMTVSECEEGRVDVRNFLFLLP